MPLTRKQVHGFTTARGRFRALEGARTVVAKLEDGSEVELPDGTRDYLVETYRIADRAGSVVAVAGDGETVSAREAAQLLGVSRPTIYKWVDQGKLTEQRDTADHRIYVESVEQLLERRRQQSRRIRESLDDGSAHSEGLLDEAARMRASLEA